MSANWTDDDIAKLKTIIYDSVHDAVRSHSCRFPEISDEEFRETWPVVKGLAKTTQQVQSISIKLVITAIVVFIIGLSARGLVQWIAEVPKKLGGHDG